MWEVNIGKTPELALIYGDCEEISKLVLVYVFKAKIAGSEVDLRVEHADFGRFSADKIVKGVWN